MCHVTKYNWKYYLGGDFAQAEQSGSASWVKCHLVYGGGRDIRHCYIPSVCWTFMNAYCVV